MPHCDICGIEAPRQTLRRCVCASLADKDCRLCPGCLRERERGEWAPCRLCEGKGHVPRRDEPAISVRCHRCGGRGQVPLVE